MSVYKFDASLRNKFFCLLNLPNKERVISFLRKFKNRKDIFIVGGAVRSLWTEEKIQDLDISVKEGASELAYFASKYLNFHFVPLSQEFGIYRIAKKNYTIDFTDFKGSDLNEDLRSRDFTFNAMAIPLNSLFENRLTLIDPFSGLEDLKKGHIRIIGEKNVLEDPLRILRGYRFFANGLGNFTEETQKIFIKHKNKLLLCAKERVLQELTYILLTSKTYETFKLMDEHGVLEVIFPEIKICKGVPQPTFHHLEVWEHMLESLKWAEKILQNPEKFLDPPLPSDLINEDFIISVKLASLFHDLGKGYTFEKKEDKITFYGHEKVSAERFRERAEILRFKKDLINKIAVLIKNHMRPVHLLNEKEAGRLTIRAKRKLIRDVPYLWELYIVAMADSLASKGPDKEPDYEERLKVFFKELIAFKDELKKEEKKIRLITGYDLINLGFKPGPIFKKILQEVEELVLEKKINSREEALKFVIEKYKP